MLLRSYYSVWGFSVGYKILFYSFLIWKGIIIVYIFIIDLSIETIRAILCSFVT